MICNQYKEHVLSIKPRDTIREQEKVLHPDLQLLIRIARWAGARPVFGACIVKEQREAGVYHFHVLKSEG